MTERSWFDFDVPHVNAERWLAWARLWWPELVVGGALGVVAVGVVVPDDPTNAEAWPPTIGVLLTALVLVVLILGVYLIERKRWRAARRARKLRYQWESQSHTAKSGLRRISVGQGVVTARCLSRHTTWADLEAALDPESGHALRGLRLDRAWGWPNQATIHAVGFNTAKARTIKLDYVPLGDPWNLPFFEEPARGAEVFIGHTVDGPLYIDLDEIPHVAVRGGTGAGKGFFIRLLSVQALRAGWLVLLLDGGMSGEHAAGDPAPTFWRPMLTSMNVGDRLQAAIDSLDVPIGIVQVRTQIGERLFADGVIPDSRWPSFPEDVKLWQPRVGLIVDESSVLLSKSGEKDLDELRAVLRARLGLLLRTGRKVGVHVLPLSDQTSTYTTALARGDTVQAEHVIILGNLDRGNIQAATDLQRLPRISGEHEKLAGFYLRRGNPRSVREIRIPPNPEAALRRAALGRREGDHMTEFRAGDQVYDTVLCIWGRVGNVLRWIDQPQPPISLVVRFDFTTGPVDIAYGPYNGDGQNPMERLRNAS